ncbi:ninjurin-1 [Trachypithecus francoisi]|nr:ninjurin-1 [Trachypithecus francoisi]
MQFAWWPGKGLFLASFCVLKVSATEVQSKTQRRVLWGHRRRAPALGGVPGERLRLERSEWPRTARSQRTASRPGSAPGGGGVWGSRSPRGGPGAGTQLEPEVEARARSGPDPGGLGGRTMDSGTEEYELNGGLPPGTPGSPDASPARWGWRHGPINVNHYANKKSAAESMLDIALLMANASQLKAVVEQGPSFAFYVPLVVLISISLALQIGVGVLLIFLVKYDLNNPAKHAKLDFLNNLATGLVFIIVVVNIFITAFGVQKPLMDMAPQQ